MNRIQISRGAMLSRSSCLALAAGAALLGAPAFAQTSGSDTDVVVVTASATPVEERKVGSSLTVVDGEMIQDQGYTYVPDVLRQVPGVAVNRTGPFGGLTQVRIRGAEGNHTLALIDGVDISSPDQGETDFSTLLSSDIQRIEVLRGPQSGLYGSNALAGVVNLITNRNFEGHYVNLDVEGGEMNTFQVQANAGVGAGRNYVSGGFHGLTTEGFDVSASTTAQGVPAVGLGGHEGDEEGLKESAFYLRGGVGSDNFHVDGFLNYLNKDAELDGQAFSAPIAGRTYDDASESSTQRLLAAGSATLSLMDGRWTTLFSASYLDETRRGRGTSFSGLANLGVALNPNGADATRTKGSIQSTYQFGADGFVSYVTGFVEGKQETFQNAFPASAAQQPEQHRDLLGYGLQYRAEIADQVFLSAVVRRDDNEQFQDADTYSVSAAWAIPNIGTRPHASFGTGVTNPTFTEQFGFNPGTFVGNPNLVPEEAEGWDVGVEQTLLDGRLVLDVTYFESTLEKEIFTAFGPAPNFLSTPDNRTTDSDRSGWEASIRANPFEGLDIVASYTNLDATEPAGIEVRRPENQAALDATWKVANTPLQVNLGVTYNGDQTDTDFGTFLRTAQDPYTVVRLGASWQVNDNIEIYGRVENLTDETYEEVIAFQSMPRAFFFGVRFREDARR
jgi:vitamin B12 transporter